MRRYVSRAVPFAVMINLLIGLLQIVEPRNRYLSVAFDSAKDAMPIHAWGWCFMGAAVILFLLRRTDIPLRIAAGLSGLLLWGLWGVLALESAYSSGKGNVCSAQVLVNHCHLAVSYRGAAFYWYVAATHLLIMFQVAPLERRSAYADESGPGTPHIAQFRRKGDWLREQLPFNVRDINGSASS